MTQPLAWAAVIAGLVLSAIMTFAYVGAFVDPEGQLDGLPVGYVNLDQPVAVGDQNIAVGPMIAASIGNSNGADADADAGAVEWLPYASREAALQAIADNEIAGVVVLPAALSQQVADIGTSFGAAPHATIEVIANPGAGSLQPMVVEQAADTIIALANGEVGGQISTVLSGAGVTIEPAHVYTLAAPIVAQAVDVPELDGHAGRGLTPLYLAVMTTLTGLIGAIAIHVAVGSIAGRERIEVMGRELDGTHYRVRPFRRFADEILLVAVLAIFSGLMIPFVAITVLGAYADKPWTAVLVCMLGVTASGYLTLLCVTAFGVIGEIVVVLITTIFGVPSARGVYPAEAIPWFFDFLGTFLPLRYLTDALRASLFFDGRAGAGLQTATIVLAVWAFASLVIGWIVAVTIDRRAVERGPSYAAAAPYPGAPHG